MDELSNLSRDGEHATLDGKPVVLGAVYRLDPHEHVERLTCAVEMRGGGVASVTWSVAKEIFVARLATAIENEDGSTWRVLIRAFWLFNYGA